MWKVPIHLAGFSSEALLLSLVSERKRVKMKNSHFKDVPKYTLLPICWPQIVKHDAH